MRTFIRTNIRIRLVASIFALLPATVKAHTQSGYVEKWMWKASDTRELVLVDGRILLRACWDIPSNLVIPGGRNVAYWKDKVETHINAEWNFYSGVRVVFGTDNCDFKIGHDDKRKVPGTTLDWHPSALVGTGALNRPTPAMILCWTFKNYAPGAIAREVGKVLQYDADYHEKAILTQATHEFGHILGLIHDQDLPDKPSSCAAKIEPALTGLKPIGVYDPKSIMNYCNMDYIYSRQNSPSCGDIAVLRAMYGPNPSHNYEPECRPNCASGLDENLAKTGAALAGCKPSPDRITGTLNNLPYREFYPDETQNGGNNDGHTIGEYRAFPSEEPIFRTEITTEVGGAEWNVKVHFVNPEQVFYRYAQYMGMSVYLPGSSEPQIKTTIPRKYASSTFPLTIKIPKGIGRWRTPSYLYYSVTNTEPKKVIVNTYEYAILAFEWPKVYEGYFSKHIRVNLGYPLPPVFEYFNAMDAKTVIPRKQMAKIPAKTTGLYIAPFFMDKYEVTQKDYMAIMKAFPFNWLYDADAPVEGVTQYDAILYCNKRSVLEGLSPAYSHGTPDFDSTGRCTRLPNLSVDMKKSGYRLPTLAEAIYAARGNPDITDTKYPWGDSEDQDDQYGWHNENSWATRSSRWGLTTHPVGEKLPNQWGLFDTFGNVMEWFWSGVGLECAGGIAYNDWTSAGSNYSAYGHRDKGCIGAASSAPFIGFRPVRNVPKILPILNFLLYKQ